jgi:hypothetical protein
MKNTFYFPHDYHARHDPKLSALIKNFGMEGYGVYWDIVEILHEQGGKLEKFPKLFEGLSHELNLNEATLKQIISASISAFNLFQEDEKYIWSDRVLDNIEELNRKRSQKAEAGRLGGIKSGEKRSKTKQNEAPLEANEQKESKVKESKYIIKAKSYFYTTYEKVFKVPYLPHETKDWNTFEDLKKNLTDEQIITLIDKFFKYKDDFVVKAGYTVQVFASVINKIQAKPLTRIPY